MSLQTKVTIREYSDGSELAMVADLFVTATPTKIERHNVAVTSTRADIKTSLTSITFIYIRRTGSDATIKLSRNLSPEQFQFDELFLAANVSGCTSLALQATASTSVFMVLAGS